MAQSLRYSWQAWPEGQKEKVVMKKNTNTMREPKGPDEVNKVNSKDVESVVRSILSIGGAAQPKRTAAAIAETV
jgi:hypothetical protein